MYFTSYDLSKFGVFFNEEIKAREQFKEHLQNACKECVKLVREKIGPVAAFKLVTVVDRLPKTRSGKILRGTMVSIADAKPYKMPATIDDPAILDEIKVALGTLGYPAKT